MDTNTSIQVANAASSAYIQNAVKGLSKTASPATASQGRATDRYEPSFASLSKDAEGSKGSAKSLVATPAPNTTDRLELTNSSRDLKPGGIDPKSIPARSDPKPDDPEEASKWSRDRLARLDQLALLVKEGHYRIEPFMVDEIALRLARAMASI